MKTTESELKQSFIEEFKLKSEMPISILVYCNDVTRIISTALAAAAESTDYEVFLQKNVYPIEKAGFADYDDYKAYFDFFCHYYDSKNYNALKYYKRLANYSKGETFEQVYLDYPKGTKMILIVENFNFWSLNSQLGLVRLSEEDPNIIFIGQVRTDFDFAAKHVDIDAATYCSHIQLDE